jgi:DNA (cytosine-5)-methyltransferase 1
VQVALAVNHWRTAIYSHQANHPDTRHICARIDDIDPRHDQALRELDLDLLMASPECTHFSRARGGQPVEDQKRATPWHVIIWAEAKRPQWIVIENVPEFVEWGPIDDHGKPIKSAKGTVFAQWLKSLEAVGYQVDRQILDSADFGAATKRKRLFIIARRGRSKRHIPYPSPTHSSDRYASAASVIDWSRPCPSIFTRKRPLAAKTLRRIEIGLRKFVTPVVTGATGELDTSFVVNLRNNQDASSAAAPLSTITAGARHHGVAVPFQFKAIGRNPGATKSIEEPVPTIVAARENHAIVVPFLVNYHGGNRPGRDGTERQNSVDQPIPTIPTEPRYALAMPYLVPHFGERDGQQPRSHDIQQPLPTVTPQGAGSVVVPYLVDTAHGDGGQHRDRSYPVDAPLGTIAGKRSQSLVLPFLTHYYGTDNVSPASDPVDTITAKARHSLTLAQLGGPAHYEYLANILREQGHSDESLSLIATMRELGVVDIGFRMLDVDELADAQGFGRNYQLFGTKEEQIRQIGNSVPPAVMKAICETIAA